MKIVNFNSHDKTGTYQAWNKQFLYHLNAQITSLQDYISYNCPEYIIFNSPNTTRTDLVGLFSEADPYQIDLANHSVSLFFPSKNSVVIFFVTTK